MKFILNTLTSWDEPPRTRHQVTRELLKLGHEVLFVEKNRIGFPHLSIRQTDPQFTLVTPFFFPGNKFRYRIPIINEIYQLWLFRKLRSHFGILLVINFDFTSHLLNRFFKRYIYYCNDEQIGNSDYANFIVDSYHKKCEISVIKNSLLCITTSEYLTNKLSNYHHEVYEIPLGGPDLDSMNIKKIKSDPQDEVVLGLVGFISLRKYSDTLVNKLLSQKNFRIVMIGPVEKQFMKKINDSSRIEQKGILTGQSLYAAMQEIDVAIAPYALGSINAGASSNKLFLYLACGLPVVISSIPNLKPEKFPKDSVFMVDNDDEFIPTINSIVKKDRSEIAKKCREFALKNTWAKRVSLLLDILKSNNIIE